MFLIQKCIKIIFFFIFKKIFLILVNQNNMKIIKNINWIKKKTYLKKN